MLFIIVTVLSYSRINNLLLVVVCVILWELPDNIRTFRKNIRLIIGFNRHVQVMTDNQP